MSRMFYFTVAVLVVFSFVVFIFLFQSLASQRQAYQLTASSESQLHQMFIVGSKGEIVPQAVSSTSGSAHTLTVTYTDSGFVPNAITIDSGDTVVFKNQSSEPFWPASNPHPVHTEYPAEGGCVGSTFDACKAIPTGGTWSFMFNVTGSWGYHDHLNPGNEGTITVR